MGSVRNDARTEALSNILLTNNLQTAIKYSRLLFTTFMGLTRFQGFKKLKLLIQKALGMCPS